MLPAGLRLYRALHPVAGEGGNPDWPSRPPGRLVWLHAPTVADARGFPSLVPGLVERGLADAVVVTCPDPMTCPGGPVVQPPPDRTDAVTAFLDHWRPDLGIWSGGALRPVLLHGAAARGLPMMLVDGDSPDLPGARWWSRLMPGLLAPFQHLLLRNAEAQRAFLRAGAVAGRVRVTGLLEEPSRIQRVNEAERAALSRSFGTRPVWLAAGVPESEDDAIAAAHLSALRIAHRLLLILVPDSPARAPALAARLAETYGLEVAIRSREDDPNEDVQVYLADTEGEMGLWYRLAPMTWCGGTLAGPGPIHHPFEAAAAGSAVLHGLHAGAAAAEFARLRGAGASRTVPGAGDLGEAVGDLLAADRCARLAQKAWDVASTGGEATTLALDLAAEIAGGRD